MDAELRELKNKVKAVEDAERDLTAYVKRLRQLGYTWEAIGKTLGVSRQAAWDRFSR